MEQAMASLCPELFSMPKQGEGVWCAFSHLGLTMYTRTELLGKRRGEGGTSPPDRVEVTLGIRTHIATLGMDDNTRGVAPGADTVEATVPKGRRKGYTT